LRAEWEANKDKNEAPAEWKRILLR
jgi:hypothetical protein